MADKDALAKLKAPFQTLGEGFAEVAKQMKPAFESVGAVFGAGIVTPEQYKIAQGMSPLTEHIAKLQAQHKIAQAFDVPPEILGLPPLDTTIHAALDTELVPLDECPANTAPYVPGHLGPTAMLVNQQPTGWQTKTAAEIFADINTAAAAYLGEDVPKKVFPAKEPGEGSGIPAHAVFTSPLIHSQDGAKETAQQVLKAHGIKIAKLDENGGPSGEWKDIGGVVSFDISYPQHFDAEAVYQKKYTEMLLKAQDQKEKQILGDYLGVDLTKEGTEVIAAKATGDLTGSLQITVIPPDGGQVTKHNVPQKDVFALMEAANAAMFGSMSVGQEWPNSWKAPTSKLSNHAMGTAIDINGLLASGGPVTPQMPDGDEMHFEVSDVPAYPGTSSFPKITTKKGGVKFPTFSKTYKLGTGATLIAYPDGVSTVELPGTVTTPGGMWSHKFEYKGTLPTDQAKKLTGLEPLEPGEAPVVISQWAAGKQFTWHPEHGWMSHQAFLEAFAPVSTAPEPLFEPVPEPPIHPQAHLWCEACDVHWMEHKGDPVECDSGGYLRKSTPLEDKQYVTRQEMLKATGLK